MVIRPSRQQRNTTAQNRKAAQRQLARDLKAGRPILPAKITSRAKAVPGEHKRLVDQIQAIKQAAYGHSPRWNAKESRLAIVRNDKTRKARTVNELGHILEVAQSKIQSNGNYDLNGIYSDEDMSDDIESAFHYH